MQRSGTLLLFLGLAVLAPVTAKAQLVDPTDPCYQTLFGHLPTPNILTTGSWNNQDHVEQAASALWLTSNLLLIGVRSAQERLQAGTLTPEELDMLRARNRCLPWIGLLLGRLEEQLKKLGGASIQVPNERRHVPDAQFVKQARDELNEAERILGRILRGR